MKRVNVSQPDSMKQVQVIEALKNYHDYLGVPHYNCSIL